MYKDLLVNISLYQSRVNPVKLLPVLDESIDKINIIKIGKYKINIITPIKVHLRIEDILILLFFILN